MKWSHIESSLGGHPCGRQAASGHGKVSTSSPQGYALFPRLGQSIQQVQIAVRHSQLITSRSEKETSFLERDSLDAPSLRYCPQPLTVLALASVTLQIELRIVISRSKWRARGVKLVVTQALRR